MLIEHLTESGMEAFSKVNLTTNAAAGATATYAGLSADSVHILIGVSGLAISIATFCVHFYFQKKRLELEKSRNVE